MSKTKKPAMAHCPFCRDGGQPEYLKGESTHSAGCGTCGVQFMGPLELNVVELWNTRSFASSDQKAAAYGALVRMGAAYAELIGTIESASKKKKLAAENKFKAASVELINNHPGTIRSALNENETDPLKHARKKGAKP